MLRILLVEDNPADAEILQMALRKSGVPVWTVLLDDGLKAVEYLTERSSPPCDIVLLDLNIPGLSGFEVLDYIKARENLKSLPVIVLSGSSHAADIDRCYQSGANSYICKPTHLLEILTMAVQLVTYWSQCVSLPSKSAIDAQACH